MSAADLRSEDLVVEIGPGLGVLTQSIADEVSRVLSIEIDRKLQPILEVNLKEYSNTKVIFQDALKTDFDRLVYAEAGGKSRSYKVIANLPYYITTPLLMHILESKFNVELVVIMVQREVAERMTAPPGKKDYGALSVAVQYYTEPEIICRVPKTVFIPAPEVDSTVIRLIKRKLPPVQLKSEKLFFNLVRTAFNQRRKTVLNAMQGSNWGLMKEEWKIILEKAGIDPMRRGETFSLQDFAMLSNCVYETLKELSTVYQEGEQIPLY
jgi:16S rRNA (adenine1518-N6/adenine1519-N6)-dimethyltransferase